MTTTPSTSRLRPRRADVREQLLRAAADAFGQHSYAEVSVAAIAAAAGFTKGAVYSNFGGKPQLFAAVFAERFTEVIGGVLTTALAAVEARSPAEVPHVVAASLTQGVVREQRLPALLAEFRSLAGRDPALAEVYAELRLRQRLELEQLLAGVADRVPLAPGVDPTVAATLLLICVNSASLEHAAAPATMPEPLVQAMLTHVLTGILA
jgi:AcrR family transcriptional regulator